MSITSLIAPQIPLLRRYARALSGSQKSGDACVVALLETLVADQKLFDRAVDPREELYRVFSRIWNAMPLKGSDIHLAGGAHDRRLDAITPLPRQAFLLTAMEGFDHRQSARILGVGPQKFDGLIEKAGKEIGALVASKAVIIEDEQIVAMALENLLVGLGHEVAGIARTHAEAVALVRAERPGIMLADVHLADGSSGIEAVNEILESFDVPVVFITAYPELLLTGERPEPAFLIAKPFAEETVKAVVSQVLFFNEGRPFNRASLHESENAAVGKERPTV